MEPEPNAAEPREDLGCLLGHHKMLWLDARRLMSRKNADYTGGRSLYENFELCEKMGITDTVTGMLVRLSDKVSRLVTLSQKEAEVVSESFDDTVVDAINYLVLVSAYRKGIGR